MALDHVPEAGQRAEAGEIAAGTIDSFLVWRLTGGKRMSRTSQCIENHVV